MNVRSNFSLGSLSVVVCCRNRDGTIQFSEFLALARRFPLAFSQLYRLQSHLQESTLGAKAWIKVRNHVDIVLEADSDQDV